MRRINPCISRFREHRKLAWAGSARCRVLLRYRTRVRHSRRAAALKRPFPASLRVPLARLLTGGRPMPHLEDCEPERRRQRTQFLETGDPIVERYRSCRDHVGGMST
jgi:hypothetical protein